MLSIAEIRAAISKLGGAFLSAIKNLLPAQLRFQGRIYNRADIQNAEQLAWYIAALGMAAPSAVDNAVHALQRSAGMSYDAEAAYGCDCMNSPGEMPREIDPVTVTLIITIIGAILKNAPTLIAMLSAPPSTAPSSGAEKQGDGASDTAEDKKQEIPTPLLIIALILLSDK